MLVFFSRDLDQTQLASENIQTNPMTVRPVRVFGQLFRTLKTGDADLCSRLMGADCALGLGYTNFCMRIYELLSPSPNCWDASPMSG